MQNLKSKKSYTNDMGPYELDQEIKKIELKHIEKLCLKKVFDQLAELEKENSSDEDSVKKKYLKMIEERANEKKMNPDVYHKTVNSRSKSRTKEGAILNGVRNQVTDSNLDTFNNNGGQKEIKLSQKCLRKILRKLNGEVNLSKDEIDLMLWEVDEDMDGKISKYEFEKMYKRCVNDTEELEPKRLYYLVQFLMYDKENKFYITEEDSLELLYIRYGDQFNSAIQDIFQITIKDENGNQKNVIKEKVFYEEYLHRMMSLALKKRAIVKDRMKNYCQYIDK